MPITDLGTSVELNDGEVNFYLIQFWNGDCYFKAYRHRGFGQGVVVKFNSILSWYWLRLSYVLWVLEIRNRTMEYQGNTGRLHIWQHSPEDDLERGKQKGSYMAEATLLWKKDDGCLSD